MPHCAKASVKTLSIELYKKDTPKSTEIKQKLIDGRVP
jgi:hypothetical protein